MILKQITIIISYIYFLLAYSYLFLTPSIILSIDCIKKYIKDIGQYLTVEFLIKAFDTKFYINNKYDMNMNSDMIDIVISNHISTCDFLILASYLRYFNIDSYNFILKQNVNYIPGFGLIVYVNNDIKIIRDWEKDKDNIAKQINKLVSNNSNNKQIILIFPEGTRYTKEKFIEGQKYSKENNYPIYNNLLVPKTKGLWLLINILKEKKKLGKIWDMTLIVPSIIGTKSQAEDLIGKSIGKVYNNIREIKLTKKYKNIDKFKLWFLNEWVTKDNIIEKYKNNDIDDYKEIKFKTEYKNLFIAFIISIFSIILLTNKYGRRYLGLSFILSYVLMFINK